MVELDLLCVYQEALDLGSKVSLCNVYNIKFILKPKKLYINTNWHSITLLNISYKLITKYFYLHLRPLNPLIIKP